MRWLILNLVTKFFLNLIEPLIKLIIQNLEKLLTLSLKISNIGGRAGESWISKKILRKDLVKSDFETTVFNSRISLSQELKHLTFIKSPEPIDVLGPSDKSFDLVIRRHVNEHVKKGDGYLFLHKMEGIAIKIDIFLTSNEYLYHRYEKDTLCTVYISRWTPKGLKVFGWEQIRSHSGIKIFFWVYRLSKRNFSITLLHNIWVSLLFIFSQIFVFRIPRLGFAFSSIKKESVKEKLINLSKINPQVNYIV
jgi:hypothetical protein